MKPFMYIFSKININYLYMKIPSIFKKFDLGVCTYGYWILSNSFSSTSEMHPVNVLNEDVHLTGLSITFVLHQRTIHYHIPVVVCLHLLM
jgi:hypothetical protein